MYICPICNSTHLKKRIMKYVEWYGDELLVIERMPALVCDTCGERVYDQHAMEKLQRLLWAPPPSPARVAAK